MMNRLPVDGSEVFVKAIAISEEEAKPSINRKRK